MTGSIDDVQSCGLPDLSKRPIATASRTPDASNERDEDLRYPPPRPRGRGLPRMRSHRALPSQWVRLSNIAEKRLGRGQRRTFM
ncbi:hypothetical protein SCUP234_03374 [Seiridium cupressi]